MPNAYRTAHSLKCRPIQFCSLHGNGEHIISFYIHCRPIVGLYGPIGLAMIKCRGGTNQCRREKSRSGATDPYSNPNHKPSTKQHAV